MSSWDIFWDRYRIDYDGWDTHTHNFTIMKNWNLPQFDQTFSALLADLDVRGLLEETLIVVLSEMGRTPQDQPQRRPRSLDVLLLGLSRRRRHPRRQRLRRVRRPGRFRQGPSGAPRRHHRHGLSLSGDRSRYVRVRSRRPTHSSRPGRRADPGDPGLRGLEFGDSVSPSRRKLP